jgi:hypothetical protein
MRRVIAGAVLTILAASAVRAEPVWVDQRILFTPAPLGGESTVLERKPSPQPRNAAIPAPKPRPGVAAHAAPRNAGRNLSVNLSKTNLDLTAHSPRAASLAAPQPQAVDFSPRIDLGGASLGLATGHDEGSGGTGLVTLDTKTPIPVDPALATRQNVIPYFGLSLSAPTN